MVKKAFFRANIPFVINENTEYVLSDEFSLSSSAQGWSKTEVQGDFLLKHINTSFNKNVVCFSKYFDGINFSLCMNDPTKQNVCNNYEFIISEFHVFCFDTGVGIFSMHIPYDTDIEEDTLVNTCSVLRCCAEHQKPENGRSVSCDGLETYLSTLAQEELSSLLGNSFLLFDHFNDNSLRRIDMFSAVLCDKKTEDDDLKPFDMLCYRLANAYDNRDKSLVLHEKDFYRQHDDYTRWSFSKRGCSVVANLTGIELTDTFLENRWFFSVRSNYFYLYLMVLHQKYAIYNYLNRVAADTQKVYLKFNQEALIEFNSKYIFSIVSDEQFIQSTYLRMKEVNNVDEVYSDLEDELKRLFEYSQLKNDEVNEVRNNKLNIISLIISVLCSASIILDTLNMFSMHGFSFGFSSRGDMLCTCVITLECLLFIAGLTIVALINNKRDM